MNVEWLILCIERDHAAIGADVFVSPIGRKLQTTAECERRNSSLAFRTHRSTCSIDQRDDARATLKVAVWPMLVLAIARFEWRRRRHRRLCVGIGARVVDKLAARILRQQLTAARIERKAAIVERQLDAVAIDVPPAVAVGQQLVVARRVDNRPNNSTLRNWETTIKSRLNQEAA